MIEKVQLILYLPQLRHRVQKPKPVIASELCFFESLEQYSEKSVHDPNGNVTYLYNVTREEMMFEQVVISYANHQMIFSYEKTNVDASEQLLEQLREGNIEYQPVSKTFLVGRDE
ncbi:hypothetical protein CSV74_07730 [Sporosarcina sp. P19]|uniref:hypothetical protein n=1 Tax=Sporosarcina sp. P19 TaxID=2048258 RepID=UPI000C1656A3|nr:hypothetical protein [Sporosarcina sp. P19]PIC77151.1 hypothetical protein CSV74_07730 [Sporosarcina sp. P19]